MKEDEKGGRPVTYGIVIQAVDPSEHGAIEVTVGPTHLDVVSGSRRAFPGTVVTLTTTNHPHYIQTCITKGLENNSTTYFRAACSVAILFAFLLIATAAA